MLNVRIEDVRTTIYTTLAIHLKVFRRRVSCNNVALRVLNNADYSKSSAASMAFVCLSKRLVGRLWSLKHLCILFHIQECFAIN